MLTEEVAKKYFPTRPHIGSAVPERMKYLLLAPPKWGKTTFLAGAPGALLLAFEEGHAFVECHKIVITSWYARLQERVPREDDQGIKYASALEVIDALEAYNPYKLIIIDTVDAAVKMCTDYECASAKIAHPSDGGDYGKGWDLFQTTPFRRYYNRLVKLGVGVGCTSHIRESFEKNKFGQQLYRRDSTLPAGIQRFIHAQSDVIINGGYIEDNIFKRVTKSRKGPIIRDRIVSFDGSDEIMAGTRITKIRIPNKYIVDPPQKDIAAPWKQWAKFFSDSPGAGEEAEKNFLNLTGKDEEDLESGRVSADSNDKTKLITDTSKKVTTS
jgi:hypothetical protein